jgi:hypothetical protein
MKTVTWEITMGDATMGCPFKVGEKAKEGGQLVRIISVEKKETKGARGGCTGPTFKLTGEII